MNDLLYSIGLDITDLKTSARAAKEQAEDIKRGFRGFKDVIEFGGVGMAVIGFFRSVIDYAQNLKGPLDENTAAVKRFGEGLTQAKETTLGWGAQFLGVLNRAGEGLGMVLRSIMDGKDAVRQAAQLEREAQENIARIEAERKRNGEEHKRINTELKKIEEERIKVAEQGLTLQERISRATDDAVAAQVRYENAQDGTIEKRRAGLEYQQKELALAKLFVDLEKEQAKDADKAADDRARAAEEHIRSQDRLLKLKFEALTTDEKIAQLSRDEIEIVRSIARMKREKLDTTEAEVALLETQAQLGKLRAEQAKALADAEADVGDEIDDQNTGLAQQIEYRATLSQTTANKDMTDRQLAERAANLRRQLDDANRSLNSAAALSPFGRIGNPFVAVMSEDLRKIQDEQAYRRRFRQAYSQQGEAALERFSAFDEERLRNYIRPEDEKRAAMTLETLQDIAARLAGTKPFGAKL